MFISISSHIRDTVPDSLSLKNHHNSGKGTQVSPWTSANRSRYSQNELVKLDDICMWAQPLHGLDFSQVVGLLQAGTHHICTSFSEGVNKITPTCIWKHCTAAQDCWKPQVPWPHCYKVKGHATWYQGQLGGRDQCTAGEWCNADILYLLMVCFIVLHA